MNFEAVYKKWQKKHTFSCHQYRKIFLGSIALHISFNFHDEVVSNTYFMDRDIKWFVQGHMCEHPERGAFDFITFSLESF